MKKYLSVILTTILACSMLSACGNTKKQEEVTPTEESTEQVNVLADKSLSDILAAIYEEKSPEFPLMETEIDLTDADAVKYSTGLTADDTAKVKEVLVSESAMGSQAYSLVLLRLNDAADAEDIAAAVKAGIDPRKWICVEADDMLACASGDVVMFVMISSEFAESVTAKDLTDAFTTVAEGNLSVEAN